MLSGVGEQEIVTSWSVLYVPGPGEKTGVDTVQSPVIPKAYIPDGSLLAMETLAVLAP